MAVTVYEQQESRAVSRSDGAYTAVRRFVVYDLVTPITTPVGVELVFGTNGLPTRGDNFPDTTYTLVALDHSIRKMEGQQDVWQVEWRYAESPAGSLDVKQPNEPGFVDISANVKPEIVECWRALTAAQISALTSTGAQYANGTPINDNIYDIGGRYIDVAGEPTSVSLRTIDATVSVTVDVKPRLGDYAAFVNRRNSLAFMGAGKGRVLYVGASIRRLQIKRWSVSHRFIVDEWLHMRQVPQRNPNGDPVLGSVSSGGLRAQYVSFVQPFVELADLYQISPYLLGE